ncbi:Putative sterol carrier protein [Rhodovulum sp. ES.010]|uniref:SCP2 sterol-binding domain-containing protein n=1 Tax=Rhodovulum sp. ES.010 TaxID=1882821 RepID=UPI00092B0D16|nr:SCP2 sterol-binding domain-containing protein [Rhodovulum sp. ES.010]SIO12772.1 Putative sterol carrier protein [Rhodovulum sp. ES.010]
MSEMIDKAVETLNERMNNAVDGVVKFVIEDEGSVIIDGEGARPGDEEADVTLFASLETFRGMMDGEVNPTAAFMTGKLKIEGDMGKAMQLAQMFS